MITFALEDPSPASHTGPAASSSPHRPASLPRLDSWRLSQRHPQEEGRRATGRSNMWAGTGLPPPLPAVPTSTGPAPGPAAAVVVGPQSTPRSPVLPHLPPSLPLTEPHPSLGSGGCHRPNLQLGKRAHSGHSARKWFLTHGHLQGFFCPVSATAQLMGDEVKSPQKTEGPSLQKY